MKKYLKYVFTFCHKKGTSAFIAICKTFQVPGLSKTKNILRAIIISIILLFAGLITVELSKLYILDKSILNRSFEYCDEDTHRLVLRELRKRGYSSNSSHADLRPWYVTTLKHDGSETLVVIEIYPGIDIPDQAYGVVGFLRDGITFRQGFEIGYRMFASDLKVDNQGDHIFFTLNRSSAGPFIVKNGKVKRPLAVSSKKQVQVFSIRENSVELVKTTDIDGNVISNSDGWHKSNKGMVTEQ